MCTGLKLIFVVTNYSILNIRYVLTGCDCVVSHSIFTFSEDNVLE